MKRFILSLLAAFVVTLSFAQETPQQVTLRTLGIPSQFAKCTEGYWVTHADVKTIDVTMFIDLKNRRKERINGKWVYFTDTVWSYKINSVKTPVNSQYLPNFIASKINTPMAQVNGMEISKPFQATNEKGYWYGKSHLSFSSDMSFIYSKGSPAASNNVIRINEKDVFGKEIPGLPEYNQGAAPITKITYEDNPPVTVNLITTVLTANGTMGRPVNKRGYILQNELLEKLNITYEQFENEMSTNIYTTKHNSNTHITATSAELIWSGNKATLKCYANGVDVKVQKPTGKINLIGQFAGVSGQFRIFNDGQGPYENPSIRIRLSNTEPWEVTFVKGNKLSWDGVTKTLTYDQNKPCIVWAVGIEGVENGKNWQYESTPLLVK